MFRRRIPVILCAVGSLWLIGCSSSPKTVKGGVSTTSSSTASVLQNTTITTGPVGSPGTQITTPTTQPSTATTTGTTVPKATTVTTVPGRVVTSPSDNVKAGDSGDGVKKIQYALKSQGYSVNVDGKFGPKTEAAVRAFQKKNGLTQDGVVGPVTWAKLSGTKTPTTPTTTKSGSTTTTTIKP
jgi:peptidoglycan hydrolase-like protein with peptidoglycan-binding domain